MVFIVITQILNTLVGRGGTVMGLGLWTALALSDRLLGMVSLGFSECWVVGMVGWWGFGTVSEMDYNHSDGI